MSKDNEQRVEIQYTYLGDALTPCGATTLTAPPGFYEVVDLGLGRYGFQPKQLVSDELIDLPGTIADEIFEDMDLFLSTKDRYAAYQMTHKRGYLFFGPPGSGKTSLGIRKAVPSFVHDEGDEPEADCLDGDDDYAIAGRLGLDAYAVESARTWKPGESIE